MKNYLLFTVLLLSAVGCKEENAKDPAPGDVVVDVKLLEAIYTPLKGGILDIPDESFSELNVLSTARLIGLGEATHGSKEFFQMKHRLFRYFVEHFNHKVFGFEMDYGESLIFEQYIQTGEGDLETLMRQKMYFWTWNTAEIKTLLQWMRTYNAGKPEKDRLHFYGYDCQTFKYNVPEFLKRVGQSNAELKGKFDAGLTPLLTLDMSKYKGEFSNSLSELNQYFLDHKEEIKKNNTDQDFKIIEQLFTIIKQTENLYKNQQSLTYWRDNYMYMNVRWLMDQSPYPISIWAHNVHIGNEKDMMGEKLFLNLGDTYKMIGFSFGEGTVTAINQLSGRLAVNTFRKDVISNYANDLLSKASSPNFLVKTSRLFGEQSLLLYFRKRSFYHIGSMFYETDNPAYFKPLEQKNFDYLIHINKSTASECYVLGR